MEFRDALPDDDNTLVAHYLAIWESYGVAPGSYKENAAKVVAAFIEDGRRAHSLGGILAISNGQIVGSCVFQLLLSPYPEVLKTERRLRGYIWSVFVEPAGRGRGIASRLTEIAVTKLKVLGCTDVLLHASDAAQPIYAKLGFTPTKEMRLKLNEGPPSQ